MRVTVRAARRLSRLRMRMYEGVSVGSVKRARCLTDDESPPGDEAVDEALIRHPCLVAWAVGS